MRTIFVVLFSLVLFGFCFSTDISACTEITAPGTYDLTDNISGAPHEGPADDACIVITASDVVLDCHGHSLSHNGNGYGIALDGAEDVTVQNCVVHDYMRGIYVYDSDSTTLIDNTEYDVAEAFRFFDTHNNLLIDNTAYDVQGLDTAFYFEMAENNTLIGNTAYDVWGGAFWFIETSNNVLEDNLAYNITGNTYYFDMAWSGNVLDGNEAYNISDGATFEFQITDDNELTNNYAYNTSDVFRFSDTGDNTLINNEADTLNADGFATGDAFIFGGTGDNTLIGNEARNVLYSFAWMEGNDAFFFGDTGNNVLTNNRAYDVSDEAFDFGMTGDNTLTNNIAYNVPLAFDFGMTGDNTLDGNTATGGSPVMEGPPPLPGMPGAADEVSVPLRGYFIFTYTGDNELTDNEATNATTGAFAFAMTGHNTLDNNLAAGSSMFYPMQGAFMFSSTGDNTLTDNTALDFSGGAFMFAETEGDNTLDNNFAGAADPMFAGGGGAPFALEFFENMTGINELIANGGSGTAFSFGMTGDNILSDNSAYNITERAFFFGMTGDNTLENNFAAGAYTLPGYFLGSAFTFGMTGHNTLDSNTALNVTMQAFAFGMTGDNTLENNFAASNSQLYGLSTAYTFSDIAGSNTLTDNTARDISMNAFTFSMTGDNTLDNNLAASNSPMYGMMMGAFQFMTTGHNTLTDSYVYNSTGTCFIFGMTGNNTLTNSYAVTSTPRAVNTAFMFGSNGDNTLTNSYATNVTGGAFLFSFTDGDNTLTNSVAYGSTTGGGGGAPVSLPEGFSEIFNDTLENISVGPGGAAAFTFDDTYGDNTLTNSEVYNFYTALQFTVTGNNNLTNTYAKDISGSAFIFSMTGNNALTDSTVIDPRDAFMFGAISGDVNLTDTYVYNASNSAYNVSALRWGSVNFVNSTYEGLPEYEPNVFIFEVIQGDVSLTDSYSSFAGKAFVFGPTQGDVELTNSHALASRDSTFFFQSIEGGVTLTNSVYEGSLMGGMEQPSGNGAAAFFLLPNVFYFGQITGQTTVTDAYSSYTGNTFMFLTTGDVTISDAYAYSSSGSYGAFWFDTDGDVTVTDSTSARCNRGMSLFTDMTLNNHHFYDNMVDFYAEEGSNLEMNNAVFDRRSGDKNVQTTLSISDEVIGAYHIAYSYQPDTLPGGYGSFAAKFLEIQNSSPTSIDEITWHWDQSEVNDGGYTESEFELWKYNGSTWGGGAINSTPDTTNNEFTQYNFAPDSVYAILEDGAPATQCRVITSPGTYQMTGDYLGAPNYVPEVDNDYCVVIRSSDVTFDCRGHRVISLEDPNRIIGGIAVIGPVEDVVVKNCVVSGYHKGVGVAETDNAEFTGNDISDISIYGFGLLNNTGNLVFRDNTVHHSALSAGPLGAFLLENGDPFDPDTHLEFTDNSVHHLYSVQPELPDGGLELSDSYPTSNGGTIFGLLVSAFNLDDATVSGNSFHDLESSNIYAVVLQYIKSEGTMTDNTAYNLHCSSGYCTVDGFMALSMDVLDMEEPSGTAAITMTGNEFYNAYANGGTASVGSFYALFAGGSLDDVVTATDNSAHDIYVGASGGTVSFNGGTVASFEGFLVSTGEPESLEATLADNTFHDIHAYSSGGGLPPLPQVTSMPGGPAEVGIFDFTLAAEDIDISATGNSMHHLYAYGGAGQAPNALDNGAGTSINAFNLSLLHYWSAVDLDFSDNEIYFLRSTGGARGLLFVPQIPADLGLEVGSDNGDDLGPKEVRAAITDNTVSDFRTGTYADGFIISGNIRSNETIAGEVIFANNTVHNLHSSGGGGGLPVGSDTISTSDPRAIGLMLEMESYFERPRPPLPEASAEEDEQTEGALRITIENNTIHHLSAPRYVYGLRTSGISFWNAYDCIITTAAADNTVHNLHSDYDNVGGIATGRVTCGTGVSDTITNTMEDNTVYQLNGQSSTGVSLYAISCLMGLGWDEETEDCSITNTETGNTVRDIYGVEDARGLELSGVNAVSPPPGEVEYDFSLEASATDNTVHHVVQQSGGVPSAYGVTIQHRSCSPHSEGGICTDTVTMTGNDASYIYGPSAHAFDISNMNHVGTDTEITVVDNTAHDIYSRSFVTGYGFSMTNIFGNAMHDDTNANIDITIADNTAYNLGGSTLYGFYADNIYCAAGGGAPEGSGVSSTEPECDIQFTLAENEVYNMLGDEPYGIRMQNIRCGGGASGSDMTAEETSCDMEFLAADNTIHNMRSARFGASGFFINEVGCEGCTTPMFEDNLVYGVWTNAGVQGIALNNMHYGITAERNTVHHAYGTTLYHPSNACFIVSSADTMLSGNQIHSCQNGLVLNFADATLDPSRGFNHIYNTMNVDLYLNMGGGGLPLDTVSQGGTFNASFVVFDSNQDDYRRFTALSAYYAGEDSLTIDHAVQPAPLPEGYISFEGKFVDISMLEGNGLPGMPNAPSGVIVSDYFTWEWFESEAEGYNEANLQLWVYIEEERPHGQALPAPEGEWILLNDTPDTVHNDLSINAAVIGDGSVYAILHNGSKTTPPDGDGDLSMDVDFSTDCEDNIVTATKTGGDPLYGATVKVFNADTLAVVASGSTDSNGEFDFPGCGFTVSISVNKGGYIAETNLIRSLVTCEECLPGCVTDDDCPEGYECEDGQCVPEPECRTDADCPEGFECIDEVCVEKPECTKDSDCADDEYCENGECIPVSGQCGYAEEHRWVSYACGREAGCPDCPEGLVCENRKCVGTGLDCPESVFVGTEETCEAAMNGDVCARCDYIVTDPTGRAFTGQTDENGDIQLPFDLEGTYKVALVKDGEVISEVLVEVVPKAPPTEEEKPVEEVTEEFNLLWLLVLLAMLVLAFLYWRRRKGEKVVKTKKKK